MQRLGTIRSTSYQIHWPSSRVPISETMRAMETLADREADQIYRREQLLPAEMRAAQAALKNYPIVANQVLYNLERRDIEAD